MNEVAIYRQKKHNFILSMILCLSMTHLYASDHQPSLAARTLQTLVPSTSIKQLISALFTYLIISTTNAVPYARQKTCFKLDQSTLPVTQGEIGYCTQKLPEITCLEEKRWRGWESVNNEWIPWLKDALSPADFEECTGAKIKIDNDQVTIDTTEQQSRSAVDAKNNQLIQRKQNKKRHSRRKKGDKT